MDAQDEIKQILFENDKTKTWLAGKLHMTKQDLGYQLDHAANFSHELYERIMRVFRAEGLICTASEKCEYVKDQTLSVGAIVSNGLSLMYTTVKNFTKDNVLDFKEKKALSDMVEEFRTKVNLQLDEIQKTIEK